MRDLLSNKKAAAKAVIGEKYRNMAKWMVNLEEFALLINSRHQATFFVQKKGFEESLPNK